MTIKRWRIVKKPENPDLLTVLKRRNQAVEEFLESKNVKNKKTAEEFLIAISSDYSVSEEFCELLDVFLASKKPTKQIEPNIPEPIASEEDIIEEDNLSDTKKRKQK